MPGDEPSGSPSPSIRGYLFSRIQTGRLGLARPGWSDPDRERALAARSRRDRAVPSSTKIVTARLGIVSVPVFSTPSRRSVVSASRWRLGNCAVVTLDGVLALGLVRVLALAAAAGGEGEGRSSAWREPPRASFGAGSRLLVPVSPKARGTYHARRMPPCGFKWPAYATVRVALGRRSNTLAPLGPASPGASEEQMVRTVADRAFLPAKSLFEQVGNMMILTGKTMTAAVRPPYPYGGEFISQFLFALQLCWFPMMISTLAFGFGAPGLQAANFLTCSAPSTASAASSSSPRSASSRRS